MRNILFLQNTSMVVEVAVQDNLSIHISLFTYYKKHGHIYWCTQIHMYTYRLHILYVCTSICNYLSENQSTLHLPIFQEYHFEILGLRKPAIAFAQLTLANIRFLVIFKQV